jgi:hypothetical protein
VELIGLYFVACVLLVGAGTAKALHPDDTARALAQLVALPTRPVRVAVRAGAMAEAALGVVAIVFPRSLTALLVATSYLVFAGVVTAVRARGGPLATCGCFGSPDTPATMVHVVIDLVLAVAALSVAVAGPTGSLGSLLAAQPLDGVPLVAVSALCAWLTYLAMSALARAEAARRLLGISRHSAGRE